MTKFDRDGITKLNDTYNDNIKGLLERMKEIKKLGMNYKTFSGLDSSMNGSVKFIIKTDEINTSKDEQ